MGFELHVYILKMKLEYFYIYITCNIIKLILIIIMLHIKDLIRKSFLMTKCHQQRTLINYCKKQTTIKTSDN